MENNSKEILDSVMREITKGQYKKDKKKRDKKKKRPKKRLSPAQKRALKKARKKSHTGQAKKKRQKTKKKRKKQGIYSSIERDRDMDNLEKMIDSIVGEAEVKVREVIADLVDTDLSSSNEQQGKFAQMIKGLAFSEDPISNKFMKGLDKLITEYGKKFLEENKE